MADSSRQSRLAAAKKKLKEYQQKNSPGAAAGTKKKRKTKDDCRPETPTGDDQQPPENIQNILKVPVSDLKRSNGVAIPSLDRGKSTSYVNGESAVSSTNIKEMEKQQNQEAVDQLEKEKMELEEKFSEEQAALREQLQVHIQTIGILVSEKSECQTAPAPTQRAAQEKSGEAESFAARLRSSRQRELELERTLASVSLQQKQAEKRNAELMKEREDLKQELYKQSKSSEEIKQQNAELSEKFRCLVSKISAKELYMKDLRKKLEMAELMIQQLSESVHQLQAERDQYVGELKEEQSIWQQQVQQLSEQVHAMADEKEEHMARGDDDVDS